MDDAGKLIKLLRKIDQLVQRFQVTWQFANLSYVLIFLVI